MTDLTPSEVATRLEGGAIYLDVRTQEEFAEGHVPGAVNVPLHFRVGEELVVNDAFAPLAAVVLQNAPEVIVGCRSGVRSRIALELLEAEVRCPVYHLAVGFEGKRDHFGRLVPGWKSTHPVETTARPEQTYPVLKLLLETRAV